MSHALLNELKQWRQHAVDAKLPTYGPAVQTNTALSESLDEISDWAKAVLTKAQDVFDRKWMQAKLGGSAPEIYLPLGKLFQDCLESFVGVARGWSSHSRSNASAVVAAAEQVNLKRLSKSECERDSVKRKASEID